MKIGGIYVLFDQMVGSAAGEPREPHHPRRSHTHRPLQVQDHQINMAVCFWYLYRLVYATVQLCHFLQGTIRPCLSELDGEDDLIDLMIGQWVTLGSRIIPISMFRKSVSPGMAGLSISYALLIVESLNWMVRMI